MVPKEYYEALNYLGMPDSQEFLDEQVKLIYQIPLTDMIGNFFDQLKSATSGYASVEYKIKEWRE
jgi:GTP-binding protein LepA